MILPALALLAPWRQSGVSALSGRAVAQTELALARRRQQAEQQGVVVFRGDRDALLEIGERADRGLGEHAAVVAAVRCIGDRRDVLDELVVLLEELLRLEGVEHRL